MISILTLLIGCRYSRCSYCCCWRPVVTDGWTTRQADILAAQPQALLPHGPGKSTLILWVRNSCLQQLPARDNLKTILAEIVSLTQLD